MSTALDIINDAVQELGVYGAGETVSGDDAGMCLSALNGIVEAWRLENLYVFAQAEVVASLPGGTTTLTIGPTLELDTARPVRLEVGCFVRVGGIDYPLTVVSRAEYNAVCLKTLDGPWPAVCTYDASYPTGVVSFWPRGACEVHLLVQVPLTAFAATTDVLALPPGYRRALALTLCEEIAPKFQRQVAPGTVRKAMNARRMLKRMNVVVPELRVGADPQPYGQYAILAG